MSKLVWTKEKPTEPGPYFYRMIEDRRKWFVGTFNANELAVSWRDYEYAGPIPLPAEPFDETVTNENTKRGEWIEVTDTAAMFGDPPCRRRFYLRDDDLHGGAIVCYSSDGDGLSCWRCARRIREKP